MPEPTSVFQIVIDDSKQPVEVNGEKCLYGIIRIGGFSERFIAPLEIWSVTDYKRQWQVGLTRFLNGALSSCIVTGRRLLEKANRRTNSSLSERLGSAKGGQPGKRRRKPLRSPQSPLRRSPPAMGLSRLSFSRSDTTGGGWRWSAHRSGGGFSRTAALVAVSGVPESATITALRELRARRHRTQPGQLKREIQLFRQEEETPARRI